MGSHRGVVLNPYPCDNASPYGENAMPDCEVQHQLDAQGLYCPEPVMMLHGVMANAAVGDVIEVLATDPSTERDIAKFCLFLSHELLASEEKSGVYRFLIRKQDDPS